MKRKIFFKSILYVLILLLIGACTPANSTDQEASSDSATTTPAASTIPRCEFFDVVNPSCKVEGDRFEITPACAKEAIANWVCQADYIKDRYALEAQDAAFLVRGFHIPNGEIANMLTQVGKDADIWAWLAIEYDHVAKKYTTRIVFEAIPPASEDKAEGDDDSEYFDFTSPCPDSC